MVDNSRQIAEWMGIPSSYLPKSYADLQDYMSEAIVNEEVIVSEKARNIAPFVTTQSIPLLNIVSYPLIRLNVALLPESLQVQYDYHIKGWEHSLINSAFKTSRRIIPLLPERIRYAPEYHRAMRLK